MSIKIAAKSKRNLKIIGPLLAIELFMPGGTMIVLACLLMSHRSQWSAPGRILPDFRVRLLSKLRQSLELRGHRPDSVSEELVP